MAISLQSGFPRDYNGPGGAEMRRQDLALLTALLNMDSGDFGWFSVVHDSVGTMGYNRVTVYYEGGFAFQAQETMSGDWWVALNYIPEGSSLWNEILRRG